MTGRVDAVLRAGLQRLIGRTDSTPVVLPAADEWAPLCARAEALHLLPLLAEWLPRSAMPDDIRPTLAAARHQRQARTAVLLRDLAHVTESLAQAGVPVVVLKGAALALTVYANPAWRYFDDVDLLVAADSAETAHHALLAAGYRPHPNQPQPDWHHLPPLVQPATGTTVELHTDVVRRYRSGWPVATVWQRALPVPGLAARAPAAADALVLTALHARHHLFDRLTFVTDAALLARRIDDWPALWATTTAAGGRAALAYLLGQARALGLLDGVAVGEGAGFGRIPSLLLSRRNPFEPLPAPLRAGALPRLVELLLLDSAADSARLARQLAHPPARFVDATGRSRARRLAQRTALALRQLRALRRSSG